jgi:hypothetical protein
MPLTNGRFPEFRFDGDYVHFKMEDGDATIECAVTSDYLHVRALAAGLSNQHTRAVFILFRDEIERLASEKYDGGSERPLVVTADVLP